MENNNIKIRKKCVICKVIFYSFKEFALLITCYMNAVIQLSQVNVEIHNEDLEMQAL